MIGILFVFLIIGIGSAIYWGIWHGTRTILENEDEKIEFLKSKFKSLKGFSFNKETSVTDSEISRVLKLLKQKGLKKGTIKSVDCAFPHNEKKPWKVFLTVKSGTWPFNDKEEQIEIYKIMDNELSASIAGTPL